MPRHKRTDPQPSRSRLRTVMLATGVVLLIAAATAGVYKVVAGGNSQRAETPAASVGRPTSRGPSTTPGPVASSTCSNASNTPGGPDPWGGCWPGPNNTGPRAGITLTRYAGQVRSDGSCMITANTVISRKKVTCAIIVNSGNLTLEDSSLKGEVYNYGTGSVLIKNTVINGGTANTETVLGSNITIEGSNLYGNQHEVYCGNNCTVKDSWLHDNHNFGSVGHQNGFISTGGDRYNLQHNSVHCVGGCTGDITFLGSDSQAVVNRNLLVATRYAAYCLYPSGSGSSPVVTRITITNNVFQRGSDGKCAHFGPVYGWDAPNDIPGSSGYRNVWSGNTWNDGKVLDAL